ncbi:MAG: AI-2E family transporter, partial [Ruminococcus sp.]|nr:AI-2E family transporter [Candidatus Apopatosoma intestinale]
MMDEERKESAKETARTPDKKEFRKKINWNRQYTTIAVYAFLVILAGILCVVFFQNYGNLSVYVEKIFSVLNPVFLGILFAYLLNPILRLFENRIFWRVGLKKGKNRLRRTLSVICTYIVLIAILVGFVMILVPQIVAGYKDLMCNMSNYIATIENWLNGIGEKVPTLAAPISKITASFGNFLTDISAIVEKIIPSITSAISGILTAVKNSLLGLVLSIYFLLAKEQLLAQTKKILRTMLSPERYELLLADAKIVDENFGGFFFGKIFDSLIIGVLCFISMAIIGIPYYPLVSLIVGVTNIIPFFGPIIGAIPSAFIIFIASPIDAVWFIILILVIQQLDGN